MKLFLVLICLGFASNCISRKAFRVVFYNVENLFDTKHDSGKIDEEFLPQGMRGWTPTRFYQKIGNIAKVISAVGEDDFPELIGMVEVENAYCLKTLTLYSPLKNAKYAFIHEESSDARGVDVCLLYDRFRFQPLGHQVITPQFKENPQKNTRDILHVWGKMDGEKLLHVFVCHFPSRVGGEAESETFRCQVASQLRIAVNSLFARDSNALVLIMGDFNDYPDNLSMSIELGAKNPLATKVLKNATLFNTMLQLKKQGVLGTHKNLAEWGFLDQFVVSTALLPKIESVNVFKGAFLLQLDEKWLGYKPYRTYNGYRWQGGFSDHLPIWLDLAF